MEPGAPKRLILTHLTCNPAAREAKRFPKKLFYKILIRFRLKVDEFWPGAAYLDFIETLIYWAVLGNPNLISIEKQL